MAPISKRLATVFILYLPLFCLTAKAQTQVEATADNSIVLCEGEFHLNAGSQNRIRIKGNQHYEPISPEAFRQLREAAKMLGE